MIKPNIPGMPNFPAMGSVTDSLEFVKNLWGGMGLPGATMPGSTMPGMVMPTFSVEEIKKKISDLKAVETWLELNMNMLRGTIQALEVQAATIATLQSMGEAMSATVSSAGGLKPGGQPAASAASSAAPKSEPRQSAAPEPTSKDHADAASLTAPLVNATAWWNMLQDQFKQAVTSAMTAESPTTPAAGSSAAKAEAAPESATEEGAPKPPRRRNHKPAK
jgi:hypothetical protein